MQTIGLFLSLGLLLIVSALALRWLFAWSQTQPKRTFKQTKQTEAHTKNSKNRSEQCRACVHQNLCQTSSHGQSSNKNQSPQTSSCPAADKLLRQFPQTEEIPPQK